jgi:hypothetical protein
VLVADVAAEAVPVLVNNVATVKAVMAPQQIAAAMVAMPCLARRPRVWLLIFSRTLCFLDA